jgi:hypothetical protein
LVVVIFYWPALPELGPYLRVHEFVHVAQDERNACFLISWIRYLAETLRCNRPTGDVVRRGRAAVPR